MSDLDVLSIVDAVKSVVFQTGEIVREAAGKTRKIRHKGRIDLVTETDIAVENMLKEELAKVLPGSNFLAEESAKDTEPGELTWIIDPLDGTTNFAHGLPMVANSVALWHRDHVALGVVNLPLMGELYHAAKGHGAYMNDNPISVTDEKEMVNSLLATGFPYAIEEHLDKILDDLRTLLPLTRGIRRPGSAAFDLSYVACGRYDGFYESALNAWDVAAGWLLVEEAGGRVTQFDELKPYSLGAKTILATNGRIHGKLSRLITD